MTNEAVDYWADIYLKLRLYIRVVSGRIEWRPELPTTDAPTFEYFLKRYTPGGSEFPTALSGLCARLDGAAEFKDIYRVLRDAVGASSNMTHSVDTDAVGVSSDITG